MSTLLKILLIASMVVLAYLVVTRPRSIREIGRKARLVAYIWVFAVILGAVMQLAGWRT